MANNKRTLVSFDWAIKSILKRPEHFDVLEGFLAALLDDKEIKILEILESESTQRNEADMYNRVDLKARDGAGKVIIIELQYRSETNYLSRMYYGTSKAVSEHMRKSHAYGEVPKVISISIVYFNLMKGCYAAKSETRFRDMASGECLSEPKTDIFAEYYLIQPKRFEDEIKSDLDEWVYMLKHSEIAPGSKSKNIEKAGEALDFAKMSPEEQSDYDYYWNISTRSAINTLDAAKKEGIEEGLQKGEKNKAIEMAKKMLAKNRPIDEIVEFTELTEEEIKSIAKP
jgi:predicted transposase/invertase (TIGR01784 family)